MIEIKFSVFFSLDLMYKKMRTRKRLRDTSKYRIVEMIIKEMLYLYGSCRRYVNH